MNANVPEDLLENLKDIHLPSEVSIWPPAWGWWLLLILSLSMVLALIWYIRRPKKPNYSKLALTQLECLYADYKIESRPDHLLMGLSILIKKVALAAFPRQDVAKLSGDNLLIFLDETSGTQDFTCGDGKILATGPYQSNPHVNAEKLIKLVRNWIRGTV